MAMCEKPREDRREIRAERERRQDQQLHRLQRVFAEWDIAGRRQPPQTERDDQHQEDTEPEGGYRQHETAVERGDPRNPTAGAERRHDAHRDGDEQGDVMEPMASAIVAGSFWRISSATGKPLIHERPEIAAQHPFDPDQVLPPDRLVQPHLGAQDRDLLRLRGRAEQERTAASPGMARTIRKTTTETTNRVGTNCSEPAENVGTHARWTPRPLGGDSAASRRCPRIDGKRLCALG